MTNFSNKKAAVDMLKNSTAVCKAVMAMRNRVVNITNDFNKSKVVKITQIHQCLLSVLPQLTLISTLERIF